MTSGETEMASIEPHCPFCNKYNWATVEDSLFIPGASGSATPSNGGGVEEPGLMVQPLVCASCGFLALMVPKDKIPQRTETH